ncbi:MAG: AI-2E family transporter [Clostridia bacterium]|nr:AI-2E family transporter [Clostridia bacterium]
MKQKYSTLLLGFLFLSGIIVVYKTVDNFNFVTDFLNTVLGILSPFITGFVIAYLLNMPVKAIEKLLKKTNKKFFTDHSKGISITAVYALVIIIFTLALRIVIPAIYKNIQDLYFNIPVYLEFLMEKIVEIERTFDVTIISLDQATATNLIQTVFKNFNFAEVPKFAQGILDLTSGVFDAFIAIIVSVYMLFDKDRILGAIKRPLRLFFKPDKFDEIIEFSARANDVFSTYVFSIVIDALLVGICSTIIMSLLKVKYALILGLVMAIFSLIPYFGAIIAVAISVIVTWITGGFWQAVWVLVSLILFQQIDGNFIGPKIMGNMLKVRPLLIIFAVTLGGGLYGVTGMIIGVPVAIVIKMLVEEALERTEKKKAQKQ